MNPEVISDLYQEEIYKLPKRTVVIIPVPWHQLSEESIQLLTKILAAVKLSPSAVRIITLKKFEDPSKLPEAPSNIILFGVPTNPMINLYQPDNFKGIPTISADALELLDDSRKKNLWVALKSTFAV